MRSIGCFSRRLSRLFRHAITAAASLALSLAISHSASALTFVLDFNDVGQPNTTFTAGTTTSEVTDFNVAGFGFLNPGDFSLVTNSVLNAVRSDFHNIQTVGENVLSPIPVGQQLDIDFVIGDFGSAASNGDGEYYVMQIGSRVSGTNSLGVACLACARTSAGFGPSGGFGTGDIVGSILSNNINALGSVGVALTSGDLTATTNALAGTISHEIAHSLSLLHCNAAGAVTQNANAPLMGTGALDLPNAARLLDREFSYSCTAGEVAGTPTVNNIAQLVSAVGLRDAPATSLPEPGIAAMFGLGFAGMVLSRRRRAA
jgi:hypothetical protein